MTSRDGSRERSRRGFRGALAALVRLGCAAVAVLLAIAVLLLLLGAAGDLPGWGRVVRVADLLSPAALEGLAPALGPLDGGLAESAARWGVSALGWLLAGAVLGSVIGVRSGARR